MAATDEPSRADRVTLWAARLAEQSGAELVLVHVVVSSESGTTVLGRTQLARSHAAREELGRLARKLAGDRGSARVVVSADPSAAIVEAARSDGVDVLVIGNGGMREQREFLRQNIANRVSHHVDCTVVLVDADRGSRVQRGLRKLSRRAA